MAVVAVVLVTLLVLLAPGAAGTRPLGTTTTPAIALSFGSAEPAPKDFWGMNLLADKSPGANLTTLVRATPTTTIVYPAGNLTESMNLTSGIIYGPNSTSVASITLTEFIGDCAAVSCQAIIGLPMEINDPATDAYEAAYIVDTLGFHPKFFVYGNEPAHWACFGLSWSQMANGHPCDTGNTTISAFANETATAIRAVSSALGGSNVPPPICLGGTGKQGPENETNWIHGLEANSFDATACAAYGMHVKPAHSQTEAPTLANFYDTLVGPQGLPADYQNVSGVTDGKPLYMTEVGAFTPKSVFTPVFIGTWAMDVLDSALVVQSMQNRIPTMGWWAWSTGGKDGLFYNGTTEFYAMYSTLFPDLSSTWSSSQLTGANGLYAEATSNRTAWSMLAVSTNISQSFQLLFNASGLPLGACASVLVWTSVGPSTRVDCSLAVGIELPAQSVVMVRAVTNPTYPVSFRATNLPTNASWSVVLNGSPRAAIDGAVNFTEPTGTYSYAVDSPPDFLSSSPSGTVAVGDAPVTVALSFIWLYEITFVDARLPTGTNWSVTLQSSGAVVVLASETDPSPITHWSNGTAEVSFLASNGTYSYAASVNGYGTASGNVTVNGAEPASVQVPLGPTPPGPPSTSSSNGTGSSVWTLAVWVAVAGLLVVVAVLFALWWRQGPSSGSGSGDRDASPAPNGAKEARR